SPLTGLRTEGCALLPRMFPPDALAGVAEAAERTLGLDTAACEEGTSVRSTVIDREVVPDEDRAVLDRFWRHPTVIALLSAADRRHLGPEALRCTLQRVVDLGEDEPSLVLERDVAAP